MIMTLDPSAEPVAPTVKNGIDSMASAGSALLTKSIAGYPEDAQDSITRLWELAQKKNLSHAKLADLVKRDRSAISKLFSGTYPATCLGPLVSRINQVLKIAEAEPEVPSPQDTSTDIAPLISDPIVQTSIVQEVADLCMLAWKSRRIVFLFGPTQSGKTTALHHFIANNGRAAAPLGAAPGTGKIRYCEVPGNGGTRATLDAFAVGCGFASQCSWADQKIRAFNSISPNDLVIWDEFSQCFNPATGTVRLPTIRLVRELWNTRKCGMVIVITDIARDEMQTGKFKKACDELWYRSSWELELQRVPKDDDLRDIAKTGYGLVIPNKAEMERVRSIVTHAGMTRFTMLLRYAKANATARGPKERPSWADFLFVLNQYKAQSGSSLVA
jgi:DNA transposition AAA+ family ATPase